MKGNAKNRIGAHRHRRQRAAAAHPEMEQDRRVAVFDLLEDNSFGPARP